MGIREFFGLTPQGESRPKSTDDSKSSDEIGRKIQEESNRGNQIAWDKQNAEMDKRGHMAARERDGGSAERLAALRKAAAEGSVRGAAAEGSRQNPLAMPPDDEEVAEKEKQRAA